MDMVSLAEEPMFGNMPWVKAHSSKDPEAFEHPAIFPEELVKDHIISWSEPEDIVYDCFYGKWYHS